jgi:cobalamin biosynthesis Mg chelatase CobN
MLLAMAQAQSLDKNTVTKILNGWAIEDEDLPATISADVIHEMFPDVPLNEVTAEKPCWDQTSKTWHEKKPLTRNINGETQESFYCETGTCFGTVCQATMWNCEANPAGLDAKLKEIASTTPEGKDVEFSQSEANALLGSLSARSNKDLQEKVTNTIAKKTSDGISFSCGIKCAGSTGPEMPIGNTKSESTCPKATCNCIKRSGVNIVAGNNFPCTDPTSTVFSAPQADGKCPAQQPKCEIKDKCQDYPTNTPTDKPTEKETETQNKQTEAPKKDDSSNTTTIVVVIIVIIAVIALAVAGYFIWKKRKSSQEASGDEEYSLLS